MTKNKKDFSIPEEVLNPMCADGVTPESTRAYFERELNRPPVSPKPPERLPLFPDE